MIPDEPHFVITAERASHAPGLPYFSTGGSTPTDETTCGEIRVTPPGFTSTTACEGAGGTAGTATGVACCCLRADTTAIAPPPTSAPTANAAAWTMVAPGILNGARLSDGEVGG